MAALNRFIGDRTAKWPAGADRFFIAQALSTPIVSPIVGPRSHEWWTGAEFTRWVRDDLKPEHKINIVIRNFVNYDFDTDTRGRQPRG